MKTISFLNQKGGVGKTTSTVSLAYALSRRGHRVLLVDADPQGSLTQGVFGPPAALAIDPGATLAAIFRGDDPFPEDVIRPTGLDGLDILPGSEAAKPFNVPEYLAADPEAQAALRRFLAEVCDAYDRVLIDCAPNLHLLSWAALIASDGLVVPLQPEDYGAQGLHAVLGSYEGVRGGPNPALSLLGYLLCQVQRMAVHATYEGILREGYGDLVFDARIPMAADIKEAVARRLPVGAHKPRGAAAKAFAAAAEELEARLSGTYVPSNEVRGEAA